MFQAGDKVWIEDSAQIDVGFLAWNFVNTHRYATVKSEYTGKTVLPLPEGEKIYCLEWDEEFSGGWNCFGACAEKRGMQISSKHLSLDFEASRNVKTIPQI